MSPLLFFFSSPVAFHFPLRVVPSRIRAAYDLAAQWGSSTFERNLDQLISLKNELNLMGWKQLLRDFISIIAIGTPEGVGFQLSSVGCRRVARLNIPILYML